MDDKQLIAMAIKAKDNAYSPYYKFKVGAAVLTGSGKVYVGCNVENEAGAGVCAERVAISQAIANGEKEILRCAVVSDRQSQPTVPCGVCRQFMAEFNLDMDVVMPYQDNVKILKVKELLPHSFKL